MKISWGIDFISLTKDERITQHAIRVICPCDNDCNKNRNLNFKSTPFSKDKNILVSLLFVLYFPLLYKILCCSKTVLFLSHLDESISDRGNPNVLQDDLTLFFLLNMLNRLLSLSDSLLVQFFQWSIILTNIMKCH